ncbi:MAG: hypothetical protein JW934_16920 [Anaerolineae bacterium]|nr:hypothetical protein [Anaerolineae bacterium]
MSRRVELLYQLQRFDTRISTLNHRYQTVKASLGESETLLQARKACQAAQDELNKWRITLRDCELDVEAVISKQKETEETLYSGRVKSPKELSDLQKENQYLQRRKISVEEKVLEAMVKADELTTHAAIANEELTVVEATWRAENAELVQEYDELRQELAQLLARHKALVAKVPPDTLEEYESLRKVRKGIAVTTIRSQDCQTCHVQVPANLIDKARDTDELIYCNGCDRILYVPSE